MGFHPYSESRERLVDIKAGFGTCPKCGKQTLQTREYEKGSNKVFRLVCTDREKCGYEKQAT